MERVLDELSFAAPDRSGKTVPPTGFVGITSR
jgi:ATP-dependent protease HslVU (ClpYQ) ATPase subunit